MWLAPRGAVLRVNKTEVAVFAGRKSSMELVLANPAGGSGVPKASSGST